MSDCTTSEYKVSLHICSKQVGCTLFCFLIESLFYSFHRLFSAWTQRFVRTFIKKYTCHIRRNHPGDRARALELILPLVESRDKVASDIYCLCGRIYKDMFMNSGFSDQSSRDQACCWYQHRLLLICLCCLGLTACVSLLKEFLCALIHQVWKSF